MSGIVAGSFVLLACFAIVCGAAIARRAQAPSLQADRWSIASGLLAALAAFWLLTAAIDGWPAILDPLGRLIGLLVPALVAWGALGTSSGRSLDRGLAAVLGAGGVLFAVSVFGYPGPEAFTTSTLDQVWSLGALALAITGTLAVAFRRPAMWGLFGIGLALMAAGLAAHVASAPSTAQTPAVAIANAAAAPLVALGAIVVMIREVTSIPPGTTTDMREIPSREAQRWLRMARAESPPEFAAALTEALGTLMRAEFCLLLTPPSSPGGLSIGGGYDLIHQAAVPGAALDARECPAIAQAIEDVRSILLPPGTHPPDVRTILKALGPGGTSPALMVPLPAGGAAVAGLVLLSPHSQRSWSDATRSTLEGLAPALGDRLHRMLTRSAAHAEVESLREELGLVRSQLSAMELSHLSEDPREADWVGVADLRAQLDEAMRTIETLEAETERLQRVADRPSPPRAEEEQLRAELAFALSALAEAREESTPGPDAPSPARRSDGYARAVEDARQPLTAIAGYTELLLGESVGLLGANQRKFLERIRTAVQRMEHSLTVLASRMPEPAPEAPADATDLGLVIEQALEVIHGDLQSRGLAVRLDLPPGAIPVTADSKTLQAIVADLLANAAAVTPSGREIHLSLLRDPETRVAILAVTDRGRGVAPDDLHRVFTATPWRDSVRGLGLDGSRLARVRSLTESIDGRAWVERDPNGGTTFFILLPTSG